MNSVSTCPICFENLNDKIKASPDNCEHKFCLPCLEKWSKLGSYCPVDRKRFKKILNLDSEAVIQIKSHKRKRKRAVYDFTAHCEVCSGSSNANVLLLCDCCDLGYHIHCLNPPLKEVPAGLWFCPTCISVEEKLKKKNGITKEIEAELGGFDSKLQCKTSIKEKAIIDKELMVKVKKLDNPTPVAKNSSILQTCYNIIAEFEDMTVRKSCNKNACSSNYLDSTISKIDKIYKTFDIVSKNSKTEQSKIFKTYSATNAYKKQKIKPFVGDHEKSISETISVNTSDNCLNENSLSCDNDLQNDPPLTGSKIHEFVNKDAFCKNKMFSTKEIILKESRPNVDNVEVELYSEANVLSNECHGNSSKGENLNLNFPGQQNFEDLESYKSVKMPVLLKCVEENMPVLEKITEKNVEKSLEKRQNKVNRAVMTSCAEDSEPSTSHVRNKSSKGTSKNLIQFSIFQRIEGIDASQEICSQISPVDVPFYSNIYLQHCSMCNYDFLTKSKNRCTLCKLKYFKTKESKRFLNYMKNFKKGVNYKKYENINLSKMRLDSRTSGTQEHMKHNSSCVLERRKHSLVRALQKVRDSKCINIVPVY